MLAAILHILGVCLLAAVGFGVAYQITAIMLIYRFSAPPARPALPQQAPDVTILKPVCGADPGLYENLRSFCVQDYPAAVQIVIGAHHETDPAVAIARELISDFPDKAISLVIDDTLAGSNFKICNLSNMLRHASHDVLVMADSDMRVAANYLRALVSSLLQPDVGLVTCLYKGVAVPNAGVWSQLSSALGCSFINHGFLPAVLVSRVVGADSGCFGASIAIRRRTLDAIGGFSRLAHQLADDYMLGEMVRAQGLRVSISECVIANLVREPEFRSLVDHELRWQRTMRSVAPIGLAASAITNPVALAGLALIFLRGGVLPVAAVVLSLAARCALIEVAWRRLGLPRLPLVLVPVRDLLSFATLVASFFGRRVTWRGRAFLVNRHGEMRMEGQKVA